MVYSNHLGCGTKSLTHTSLDWDLSISRVDHYVYSKQVGNHFIYVVLYVDDMLLVGNNMDVIKVVKL
jgi:hypothetical protein